jgi:hypothetical protein
MAMKKFALLGLSIFLLSSSLQAQKLNNIKTDLLSPFLRTGVIKYERVFTESIGAQLGFFYTGYSPRDCESSLSGYGITPEFRFYLSETPAPSGTYLAPNFRYMKLDVHDPLTNVDGTLTSLGLAINLGTQVLLKDIVLIDAWVGPVYAFRSEEDPSGQLDAGIASTNGFGIRLGLAIGIAF